MRRSWKAICVALAVSLGVPAASARAQGPMMTPQMMAQIPADAIPPGAGAGMNYYPGAEGTYAPGAPPMAPGAGAGIYGPGMAPMPPGAGAGMVYYPGASMGPPQAQPGYGGGGPDPRGYAPRGGGDDCGCGSWFMKHDALWLDRSNAGNQTIALQDDGSNLNVSALNTNDDNFDMEIGYRVFAGRYLPNGVRLEAGYFGWNHWTSSANFVGAGGDLSVPFSGNEFPSGVAPAGFTGADAVGFSYDSNLHNAEFNIAKNFFGSDRLYLSNLIGFRYFYLQEEFAITANTGGVNSIYRTRTTNNLIGGQIGTEGGFRIGERVSVDTWGKLGLFGNVNSQSSQVNDAGTVIQQTNPGSGSLATVIDFGVNGTLALTQRLSLRGGYDVIIVSGLALAPDQIDFTISDASQGSVNDTGSLVFYGPHIGADFKW